MSRSRKPGLGRTGVALTLAVLLMAVTGCAQLFGFGLGPEEGPRLWACHSEKDQDLGRWVEAEGAAMIAWHGKHGDPFTEIEPPARAQCSR